MYTSDSFFSVTLVPAHTVDLHQCRWQIFQEGLVFCTVKRDWSLKRKKNNKITENTGLLAAILFIGIQTESPGPEITSRRVRLGRRNLPQNDPVVQERGGYLGLVLPPPGLSNWKNNLQALNKQTNAKNGSRKLDTPGAGSWKEG